MRETELQERIWSALAAHPGIDDCGLSALLDATDLDATDTPASLAPVWYAAA